MKIKDIFYSVMQKDNNPFENPRIVKFKVEKIDNDSSYPIVSTKQDRWGKLKEWVVKENSHAGFFDEQKIQTLCEIEEKMQELEDGKDTNVSTKKES